MIQANLLLPIVGKAPDSFVVLDLMRLPLGILSGMGFIGAGTILRKGNLVTGLTTAATLWFVTVMGLCFGGGQIALGLWSLALGIATLWGLKHLEEFMRQAVHGTLTLALAPDAPTDAALRERIGRSGCQILSWGVYADRSQNRREITCELQYRAIPSDIAPPAIVEELRSDPVVIRLGWLVAGTSHDSASGIKREGTPSTIR